jgi:hypothetical protein
MNRLLDQHENTALVMLILTVLMLDVVAAVLFLTK